MFDFWPKPKSVDESTNIVDKNSNVYPSWSWSTTIKDANGNDMTVNQLITKYNTLLNENKILREELESIEEDGTEEHNNAIKLREENVELKGSISRWMNLYQEVVDKNNALLNKGGLKYMEAKLQIVQNNYKKCASERDEYKHQLNAANKENEKLKKDIIDYVYEKDEEKSQYPIHWGGWDGAASAHPEEYSKWLNEQKDKAVADDLETRVKKLEKAVEELKIINTELTMSPLDKCIEKYGD
jgi:chromosome segregation ATPase